jgi:16S rRNA (uracil1498-N3)-methyltransferase
MNLFYANPEAIQGNLIQIEGQESIHMVKVLRHNVGDRVYVTDGLGYKYDCTIDGITKKSATLLVNNKIFVDPPKPSVSVAIGLIKKRDRLEFAVEKITELGAREIFIFVGDHSEKSSLRLDRVENSVLSAMKQSLRFTLPEVHFYRSLESMLEVLSQNGCCIIADETIDKQSSVEKAEVEDHISLIIGPEGGFSEKEREMMFGKYKALTYSLGPYRLRTETAAIVMTDRFTQKK